jgi:DNA-directed RNA polymerase specialized sigma24 family protein
MKKENLYNAQLTSYFVRVIRNQAAQYSFKKHRYRIREKLIEDPSIELVDSLSINDQFEMPNVIIFNVRMYIEDEKLKKVLEELNDKEKFVIINKIVFDQTDEEISNKLGVGRAAVTNFKNRLYQRIIKRIKNTK